MAIMSECAWQVRWHWLSYWCEIEHGSILHDLIVDFFSMQFSSRATCEKPNVLQVHFCLFWTCARPVKSKQFSVMVIVFLSMWDMKGLLVFYYVSSFIFGSRHHHGSYVHETHGKRIETNACSKFVWRWRWTFGVWLWHWTFGFGVGHLDFGFGDGRQLRWRWRWTFGFGVGRLDLIVFVWRWRWTFGFGVCLFHVGISAIGLWVSVFGFGVGLLSFGFWRALKFCVWVF